MKKQSKISSRDLGLEFAAICGKHFLGLEHLHYGYWPDGMPVNLNNLRAAQENYTDFLFSHIPAGVSTILDVGCGAGQTSKRLVENGYRVDCVSPSPVLAQKARELLGDRGCVFECRYEDLETENRYDLVLFSESFQYIKMSRAIKKTYAILNPAGYILICDIFKKDVVAPTDAKGHNGGHQLGGFYKQLADNPFEIVEELDITERTTPNLDLMDDAMRNALRPIIDSTLNFLTGRYPLMSRFLRWMYKKRIDHVYDRYFNGNRSSDDFGKFKSYRLFLCRSKCAVTADLLAAGTPSAKSQTACPVPVL